MASAVGHISGGHFNPAVTLGFFVTRRIEPKLAATYWFAQFVSAMLAAFALTWLLPQWQVDRVDLGVPALGPGISGGAGVAIEAILTFFLVWVIFATAADPPWSVREHLGASRSGSRSPSTSTWAARSPAPR
jgi:aquaporin TIP